jgi:hypothetical protein
MTDQLATGVAELFAATSTRSCAEIGHMFVTYVLESNHNSWEGFESRDKAAMGRMLQDMARWIGSHEQDDLKPTEMAVYTGSRFLTSDR